MPNPLFSALGGNAAANNPMAKLIADVQNFQKTFNGNPREEVQKLLNSGRLSQQQFNEYAQMANQLMAMMPK